MLKQLILLFTLLISIGTYAQLPISLAPASDGQTFNTCNGFIIDSGGQGGPGYSNNENTVITLCPDTPGEIISVVFNLFALDLTDDNPAPNITNVDVVNVFDGTSTAANSLGTYSGNQLQGVVIEATQLNPTGCITLQFISNTVGTGMFSASVSCETPCNNPQAGGTIVGGITSDSIRVCVGDEVTFQDQGSFAQFGFNLVDYTWDFQDGTTGNGQTVNHTYSTPGQYKVQLFVTDDNGCTNPNLIDLEVLVGTIPDFTGFPGDSTICLGESVTFVADPESYEVEWSGFPGSESIDDGCLPDTLLGVSQDIELLQTGFSAGTTITDVTQIQSVCFDLEHSFMGDLVVIIECPNGQSTILHQQGGGGTQIGVPVQADNVDCSDPTTQGTPFTYCFTPGATETWVEWVNNNPGVNTIPAGDYEPVELLDNLVGCPTNGVWTLTVIDNWAADDGTLFSFGLTLDPSFYPPVTTFEPQIGNNSDSSFWQTPAQFETNLSADANEITLTPTNDGTFTYQYFVMDNFGCEFDTTVNLIVEPNPIVFAGNDTTLCGGNMLQLNGEISGPGATSTCDYVLIMDDTFGDSWNGNTLTVTANGVSTDYTMTTFGGTETVTIPVPSGTNVDITFNADGAFVGECSYVIQDEDGNTVVTQGPNLGGAVTDVIVPTCTPDFVFEWTAPTNLDDASIQNPVMNVVGPETLTLTVYPTGHPLCAVTDDISISLAAIPDAGQDAVLEICSNGTPQDLFPLLGATADPSGNWLDPVGAAATMPYDPVTMDPGTYSYIVDVMGCLDTARVDVTELITDITSVTGTNVSCNTFTDGSFVFDGDNIDSYTINGGAATPAVLPQTVNTLAAGTYTIVGTSNLGCSDTETIEITEPDVLTVTATPTDASCFSFCDGSAVVTPVGGTAPYAYTWQGGAVGDQNGNTSNLCAGNYSTDILDANGCTASVDYVINEPANILPTIMPDATADCSPFIVNFQNTTVSTEVALTEVDFGDGNVEVFNGLSTFSHTYENPGLYTVSVLITANNGCQFTETYTELIEVYSDPNANFFVNPNPVSALEPVVSLVNQSSLNIVNYEWEMPDGNPATASTENVDNVGFPIGEEGLYPVELTITDANGCQDSIVKYVNVENDVLLFAPNAFTPDDDEFNQAWYIHISGIDIYDFNLKLFNRWGELIWESNDPSVGWDGTFNGRYVQDGTYTWTIECADANNDERYTFNGHVTIIR